MPTTGHPGRHFDPDNPLEEAMLAALVDPDRMHAFLEALAEAVLLLPVVDPPRGRDPAPTGRVRFPVVEIEGRVGVAAYTSPTRIVGGRPDVTAMLRIPGKSLADIWDTDRSLLLNPGAELGIELPARTVLSLARTPERGASIGRRSKTRRKGGNEGSSKEEG